MKITTLILILLGLSFTSCEQSILNNQITCKDGLYIHSETGEILDGKYKRDSLNKVMYYELGISTYEFEEGIPVKWSHERHTAIGTVHTNMTYVDQGKITSEITSMTLSQRTDLALLESYFEGNQIIIELIKPTKLDTNSLKNVTELTEEYFLDGEEYNRIEIIAQNDSSRKKVFERNF